MKWKIRIIMAILLSISIFVASDITVAKTNDKIIFNDKKLQDALNKYYGLNDENITEEKASKLSSRRYNALVIENSKISDLEGLQYFDNLITLKIGGNNLDNLKSLSSLKKLSMLVISNNKIKGEEFEDALNTMGKIDKLNTIILEYDGLTNIKFLGSIGNLDSYHWINMKNNEINDISILKETTSLENLDLSNNRITDVIPLQAMENITYNLDLRDNCIIDYKPIKPLLDKMFSNPGIDTGLERYDYYTNPVNFKYNKKTIKFPYLTAYYKYQAYAEANPLFMTLGGSTKYYRKTGTLTCEYEGNVLVMKDFSKKATLNGKKIKLNYPMRRMQYDLAYVPVKDICDILGLNYDIVKTRRIYREVGKDIYAPKEVEISKAEKELG